MNSATTRLSELHLPERKGWYTKCVVLVTSVFSVAVVAIPASMLTWGFEAERMARRARKRSQQRQNDSSSSNSSSDNLIAGEDDEEEYDDEPWKKRMREAFAHADSNKDGTLALQEAQDLMLSGGAGHTAVMETRLAQLEADVAANAQKLDQILLLLQAR